MAIFRAEILSDRERKFKDLYQKYYAPFCLYAKRFINDAAEREDIVSETFAKLWDRTDSINLDSVALIAYIKLSVRNACLNHIRHRNYESGFCEAVQGVAPIYEQSPDTVYTIEELYKLLDETLELLPETHRKVFVKTYFDGMKQEEIARELDISVKSVGRYKRQTIEFLKAELKDFLPLLLFICNFNLL